MGTNSEYLSVHFDIGSSETLDSDFRRSSEEHGEWWRSGLTVRRDGNDGPGLEIASAVAFRLVDVENVKEVEEGPLGLDLDLDDSDTREALERTLAQIDDGVIRLNKRDEYGMPVGTVVYLHSVDVHPALRHLGLGTCVAANMLRTLTSGNWDHLIVTHPGFGSLPANDPMNVAASSLVRRLGFATSQEAGSPYWYAHAGSSTVADMLVDESLPDEAAVAAYEAFYLASTVTQAA